MAGKTSDGATNLMECPICSKSFKLSLINRHVNDCLASTGVIDSQDVNAINTRKRKASDESPVKKSSFASSSGSVVCEEPSTKTAWGSLMPQSPLSSGSKKKKKKVANTQSLTSPDKDTNESPKSPKLQSQILPQTKSPLHEIESDHGSSQPSSSKGVLMFEKNKTGTSKSSTPKAGAKSPTKKSGSKKSTKGIDKLDAEISESIPADHDDNGREETETEEQVNGFKSDVIGRSYSNLNFNIPLAETARPTSLDDYIGQEQAVGKKSSLCLLLKNNDIPSIILWGPPGCGKTTLAKIIANSCKNKGKYKFCTMSATSAGVNDVKEAVKVAKNDLKMFKRRTIIFLDEIHRFNKLQQDALLPHVEDGTIVLIGATTENPSFQVNSALLSRCKVIVLEKLEVPEIETVLTRALDMLGVRVFTKKSETKNKDGSSIWIEREAVTTLAGLCDGDARCALNSLQLAIQSQLSASKEKSTNSCTSSGKSTAESPVIIDKEIIKEGLQRSHVLYDRAGEEHYNIISALHKSMRGSDENAALYWLARMLEGGETPLYIARRLVRFASEDIGLADPQALNMAVSTYQACHFLGMPECDVILAHCAVYMSRATKSVEVYKAYGKAKQLVRNHKGPMPGVPLHLRNAPTKLMKSIGYGKNYKYNPDFKDPVDQAYLPPELMGVNFFT